MSPPDVLIAGRYRLVNLVGTGGMGVVWEAWDERLHRAVALKQLHPQPGLSHAEAELANDRAMREARITARLHHPYAVPVFDVVEHDGHPCLVMQYLPSKPLSAVLQDRTRIPAAEAATIGAQVASALAAAHQVGIVHRDVKPGNILIDDNGTARISDFGISHALGDVTLTSTGMVTGTPAYLAPEVARGGEFSVASDVFSLGSTLYTAMEGTPPFGTDPNSMALLHRVASGRYEPPSHSGALSPILLRMLSADPADRPSMIEVADRLADLAAHDGAAPRARATTAVMSPALMSPTVAAPTVPTPTVATPRPAAVSAQRSAPVTPREPIPAARGAVPTEVAPPPAAPAPPQRSRRRAAWAALAVLAVLAVAVAILATLLPARTGGGTQSPGSGAGSSSASTPATTASTAPSTSPTSSPTSSSPRSSSTTSKTSSTSASSTSKTSSTSASSTSKTSSTTRPSTSSSPTTSSTAPAAPPSANGSPTAAQLASAITGYYALMPGNTDQGWSRLTSSYQTNRAHGRGSYQRFWDAIARVSASGATGSPPGTARATITYYFKDGRVVRELTSYGLVNDGGVLKINSSTVLSSR